jgi:branched-chain amino acid transport system ATP-binding protein
VSVLELRGIRAGYGAGEVLHAVDLALGAGELLAVLGPNGAGTSSLLQVVAGHVRARTGAVLIDGVDLAGAPAELVARCGVYLVPEGRAAFPSLTVAENLRISSGAPERTLGPRIDRALEVFPRLAERRLQLAGTMSGGEQRMLALARAFVAEPRVLLLDEPSLGLAPLVVDEVFDAIRAFRSTGTSIVLVEQYVHRALAVADVAMVLASGRVAWRGPASELDEADLADRYLGGAPVPTAPRVPVRRRRSS